MAKLSMLGSGGASDIVNLLCEEIQHSGISCELVDSVSRTHGSAEIHILVFEKYFWRAGNRASLTVVVSGDNGKVLVDAIGSGGGQGPIIKFSWGTEEDFIAAVESILEQRGFRNI